MPWLFNPLGGKTIDRRAGCGRTARPVRRGGSRGTQPGFLTPITSPASTVRDGLTGRSSIITFPFRQASVACDRVLNTRTAHRYLSIRDTFIFSLIPYTFFL